MNEREIRWFFDYFRKRRATIEQLDDPSDPSGPFSPDQSVILATAMDALAMYWASAHRPDLNANGAPARVRMQTFLETFGRADIFGRVSGPDLKRRAHSAKNAALVTALRALYQDDGWDCRVRAWNEDRTFSEVLGDPAVAATATSADFIARSQYGQLLYREFRCAWVHELRSGDLSTRPFSADQRYTEPHYENWIARGGGPSPTRRRAVFPRAFLLATLTQVIDGFEAKCIGEDRCPVG